MQNWAINGKSVDGILRIWILDRRMVGAIESTGLWRPPPQPSIVSWAFILIKEIEFCAHSCSGNSIYFILQKEERDFLSSFFFLRRSPKNFCRTFLFSCLFLAVEQHPLEAFRLNNRFYQFIQRLGANKHNSLPLWPAFISYHSRASWFAYLLITFGGKTRKAIWRLCQQPRAAVLHLCFHDATYSSG